MLQRKSHYDFCLEALASTANLVLRQIPPAKVTMAKYGVGQGVRREEDLVFCAEMVCL